MWGGHVTQLVSIEYEICELVIKQAEQLLHIDDEKGFSEGACASEEWPHNHNTHHSHMNLEHLHYITLSNFILPVDKYTYSQKAL